MATLKVRLANLDLAASKWKVDVKSWPRGLSSVSALLGSALCRPAHPNGVNADEILKRLAKNTVAVNKELAAEFQEVFKVKPSITNLSAVLAFRVPNKITQTLPRRGKKATDLYAKICTALKFEAHRKGTMNKQLNVVEDPAAYVAKYAASLKPKAPRTARPPKKAAKTVAKVAAKSA